VGNRLILSESEKQRISLIYHSLNENEYSSTEDLFNKIKDSDFMKKIADSYDSNTETFVKNIIKKFPELSNQSSELIKLLDKFSDNADSFLNKNKTELLNLGGEKLDEQETPNTLGGLFFGVAAGMLLFQKQMNKNLDKRNERERQEKERQQAKLDVARYKEELKVLNDENKPPHVILEKKKQIAQAELKSIDPKKENILPYEEAFKKASLEYEDALEKFNQAEQERQRQEEERKRQEQEQRRQEQELKRREEQKRYEIQQEKERKEELKRRQEYLKKVRTLNPLREKKVTLYNDINQQNGWGTVTVKRFDLYDNTSEGDFNYVVVTTESVSDFEFKFTIPCLANPNRLASYLENETKYNTYKLYNKSFTSKVKEYIPNFCKAPKADFAVRSKLSNSNIG